MNPESIKDVRSQMGLTQQAFAELLGVTFATINRWENGKAKPQRDRIERIRALSRVHSSPPPSETAPQAVLPPRLDFEGSPQAIKLVVDACRLQNGHLFNKAFGLELSRVVPLPHQRIAVYEHMLTQNPLRYLLADDAGAGKTIMTGLYIREMVNRGRIKRALICSPAGLTWNWRRELSHFFDLEFTILRGSDFQKGDPLREPGKNLFIISVDTVATDAVKERLTAADLEPFDLVVFDEAHKLSWTNPKRGDTKTQRYRLAEALSTQAPHLLLLTATPHMGKPFPYFALWHLLDSKVFSTMEALGAVSQEKRRRFFIRRLKEEMVNYQGLSIYKPRLCQTINFRLSEGEQAFYDAATEYLKWSYDTNKSHNKNAAAMVVAVFQRRLASSAYAMVESLKRRREKLLKAEAPSAQISLDRLTAFLDSSTADEGESDPQGREGDETIEDAALSLAQPAGKQLEKELEYLDRVIALGGSVMESQRESKFLKLRELIESAEFHNQQLLIFTEHRDTLDYLKQRFEALGYTGQVASIHGGMDVEEREAQRMFFMPPQEKRRQSLPNPAAPHARIMLATDAAGEGLNMQFAWVMVNYDIPWNPARLEQRMGRLHRFGQTHPEVRIFNLVAEGTREGDVLTTLLAKLDEARKELCTDKVFDVVGQQLQEISLRDLIRDALFETAPYSAQKKLESLLATQRLRATVEEQRKQASSYGDVAQRLGQLNSEIEVENFNRLLPAYVQNFVEHAAPLLGVKIEGDVATMARFGANGGGQWLRTLGADMPDGLPDFITVRRDAQVADVDPKRIAFLRPGDRLFDALCAETVARFKGDVERGGIFCDPGADAPYFFAVYLCQVGCVDAGSGKRRSDLFDKRLIAVRWDERGEFQACAPNHLLALREAPRSIVWKAGALLVNPEDQVRKADGYARSVAESTILQQIRTALRAEAVNRVEDLIRGYDYRSGELAERRSELSRRVRSGDSEAQPELDIVRQQQSSLDAEKAEALIFEERRAELAEVVRMERIAVALVVPDTTEEAREAYDKDIEAIAMRIARNYEIDRYQAKVVDVSSPVLAYGYDLQSHRPGSDRIAIEVKGRAGRGTVQLTDNEWPTAANLREKYWLYVVFDCSTDPKLFRVCDPIRLAFNTRTTFSINAGEIIKEADPA